MHYRVEIQREGGRKRRQPEVVHGQITSYTRAFGTRSMVFLKIEDTGNIMNQPQLYNPTVLKSTHEGLLFSGLEITADGAWVVQSWWCTYSTAEATVAAQRTA